MAVLGFEQRAATTQFKVAHADFQEHIESAKNHEDHALREFILKRVIHGCSSTGSDVTKQPIVHFPLGRKYIKLAEEEESTLREHLNRQYSWLLVSAHEEYERFLKHLYACMGYLDTGFWQCDDYGSVCIPHVANLKLSWFKARVTDRTDRRFRHNASHALARFRRAFPVVGTHEGVVLPAGRTSIYPDAVIQQKLAVLPLGLTCSLARELRHAIVHEQGIKKDTSSICRAIGANGRDTMALVEAHLKECTGGARIWLVNDEDGLLDYKFLDVRISHIFDSLCAHACLVYRGCILHFGKRPFWERSH